ncbi:radical SAM protein [Methylococcus sp. EFPC2]|uniref:radical SAM protein n=1 Tax=Methylococcus sp. EFPC2 TaxID=2812648 RepID=UPI001967EA7D|nr:radical SAM protein [Methylococcus sp. EFPC2]QSA98191.1 radical SAM protein [Methylococcus sp. EFPC2]
MGRYDHSQYVSMTLEFRCNLKCVHCMIEGTMDRLQPESQDRFQALLQYNAQHRAWKGLIMTGSEITLNHDLPDMARMAREAGFQHVRIQTHGMHLAQESYCRKLVEAGVDEFFVSVAGPDEESHDEITGVAGSFTRMLRGLENLEAYEHVHSITNTVVTAKSYRLLPAVVDRLAHLKRLTQMEYWLYWPMSERDEKDLIARHADVLPYLRQAIAKARGYGRDVEVKNFPECLLGEEGEALVNTQPQLFIDPAFWKEFGRNGFYQCVHRERCGSKECLGLNTAYVGKYGLEQDSLHPVVSRIGN